MGKNVDEIVVGANGSLWSAAVGTTAPATEVAVPAVGWTDLGYANEDGVVLKATREQEAYRLWQMFYPGRYIITARDFTAAFNLAQFNPASLGVSLGGGDLSEVSLGHYKYAIPADGTIAEKAFMLDWVDGTKHYRLIIPRAIVVEDVETTVARTAPMELPVTLAVVGDDTGEPAYILTDDPAFNPA